jgi:hypothetical protein
MRQHFYTYPIVVELRGERPDPRSPRVGSAYPHAAPQNAAEAPEPRLAAPDSSVR